MGSRKIWMRGPHSEEDNCLEFPVFTVFSLRTVEVNCVCGVEWQGNYRVRGIEIQRTDGCTSCSCQGVG